MKKFYLLSLLLCLSASLFAGTVYIHASGPTGSYTTGASSTTTRFDDNIACIPFVQRGYAVFDIASNLPPGAIVTGVNLTFNIVSVTPGMPGNTLRGYNGDLSAVTTPATLYGLMGSATTYYTGSWGTTPGPVTLFSNPGAITFVQNCFAGSGYASMIWAAGGAAYTITGETGTTDFSGAEAPYLQVTYRCSGLTLSATTTPATPICPNTTFTLNGTVSGATTYEWSGPSGYTSTSLNPTITGGAPSALIYTLSATTAAGCTDHVETFPIVQTPPLSFINVLNYQAFCPGDFAQLEGPVPFGPTYDYQWYDNGVAIPGATDAQYNSSVTATLTLQTTDQATGCTATTATPIPVKLFDAPATLSPGNPLHLCPGNNGTLTVDVNGITSGIDYQWQKNGTDITGATTGSYIVTASGSYRVLLNVTANSCKDTSMIDTVIVNASPNPPISFSAGALHAAGSYSTYQWFVNTVAVPGATSSSYVPAANGSYRVKVSDATGCSGYSSSYPYYVVGVGQLNMQGVSIYPNPAHSLLHIESPVAVKVVISGLEGRQLLQQAGTNDMDISALANGIYLISLYNDAGERIAVQQFIKD